LTGTGKGFHLFGVEDGSFGVFHREAPSSTFLCGVLMEYDLVTDVRLARICVDGFDATEKLLNILDGLLADAIVLGGITFAGFNMVDPRKIFQKSDIPVIVYSGKKPDNEEMLQALTNNFHDWQERWKVVAGLGPIHSATTYDGEPPVYFEVVGGSPEWAEKVLRRSALISRIPEPVRVAGLIARGLSPAS
jgi:endonuclease V-like protein UPF0215 family